MTYKQIFIVNSDLSMGKGKIVAQCLHSIAYYLVDVLKDSKDEKLRNNFNEWFTPSTSFMKKVVLKATEAEIQEVITKLNEKNIKYYEVHDAGLTQVLPGSFTCMCIEPLSEEVCSEISGHLKLL